MKAHTGEYDAILVDSTDPIGMAEAFSDEFYRLCRDSLSPQGVMSMQDGVVFFQRDGPRARSPRCAVSDSRPASTWRRYRPTMAAT